ncbi:MAG: glutaredoxin family protein [Anaerolineae bacterium]|nr:glutaredoxin family protein [Anaerolineae bacterium]
MMTEERGHIEGVQNKHQVLLYALSTCIWCKKTRQFLEDEGLTFDFVYVDLVDPDERREIRARIREMTSSTSFPATIIDEKNCIIGYKPDKIKEHLGL